MWIPWLQHISRPVSFFSPVSSLSSHVKNEENATPFEILYGLVYNRYVIFFQKQTKLWRKADFGTIEYQILQLRTTTRVRQMSLADKKHPVLAIRLEASNSCATFNPPLFGDWPKWALLCRSFALFLRTNHKPRLQARG